MDISRPLGYNLLYKLSNNNDDENIHKNLLSDILFWLFTVIELLLYIYICIILYKTYKKLPSWVIVSILLFIFTPIPIGIIIAFMLLFYFQDLDL